MNLRHTLNTAENAYVQQTANYLGYTEMPAELVERTLMHRKERLHPYDAMWELRRYLGLTVPA